MLTPLNAVYSLLKEWEEVEWPRLRSWCIQLMWFSGSVMRKGLVEVQSLSLNMLARSQFESLFHPYIHPTHLCLFPSLRSLNKPVISSKLWLFLRSIAKGFFCFSYVHWIEDWGSRESREPLMANRAIFQTTAGDLWHQQPSDAYQTCSPLSNWLIYRRIACSCSSIRAFVGWCARCSRVHSLEPSLEPPRGLRAIRIKTII